jgi:predicted dehydrogenase/threonine dehydrogenase-like Zn-dependent dehydrogenase
MKAVMQSYSGGSPNVVEVPPPALLPGGLLVQNARSLVSAGTERLMVDLAQKSLLGKARARPDLVRQVLQKVQKDGLLATVDTVRKRLDVPMPLGYSSAGVVLEVADGVSDFRPGDRVACAGAGYANHAEVIFVPRHLAAPVPDAVPFEAAAFTTVGAIALQGLRLAKPELGETVVVIGLGLVGLLTVQLTRAAGCRVLGMDTDPERCRLARELGVEFATEDPDALHDTCLEATGGHGADRVLVTASTQSSQPVELAGHLARRRGTVVVVGAVGLELPRPPYYQKELEFRLSCSYGPGRYDPEYEEKGRDYPYGHVRWTENRNLRAFLDQLAAGTVVTEPLVSHRFPIDGAPGAYELLTEKGAEPSLGIVLEYPEPEAQGSEVPRPRRVELAPRKRPSPDGRIRLGVLGAGQFAAGVLLPVIANLPRVELVGVCNATGIKARHVGRRFGFRFATTEPREILEHPEIDTVLIATRHHLHAPQVLSALEAGLRVFVEKPLCLREDELTAIEAACAAAPAPPTLMVGYNRRFAPMTRRLAEHLARASGPKVMHYRINAGYLPPEHWTQDPEVGGGRLLGEACHFVDYLTFLAGAPPSSWNVCSLPTGGRYRDDNLVITLTFPDGSLGTVTYVANGDPSLAKERCEVFCGGTAAVLDNFRRLDLARDGRTRTHRDRLRQDKGHGDQLRAFFGAAESGAEPPIPLTELFAVARVTLDLDRQLRRGEGS